MFFWELNITCEMVFGKSMSPLFMLSIKTDVYKEFLIFFFYFKLHFHLTDTPPAKRNTSTMEMLYAAP